MRFHFFTSLFLLVAAAFMAVLGLFDPQIYIYVAMVEFVLGIQQIVSSLVALVVLKNKTYFLRHLAFSALFILLFIALSWLGVSDHVKWPLVFSLPWAVGIYHTYKLYTISRV